MVQNVSGVQGAGRLNQPNHKVQPGPGQDFKFQALLQERLLQEAGRQNGLQFSKHASQRVEQRGIQLTEGLLDSLNLAVEKARSKGARDVVVIGDDHAFIVNVPNNVVVTTMSGSEMKENIFTNIDSAVLL